MQALIGYTGFVGKNLLSSRYLYQYNSKNIGEIVGKEFDKVVCAGVRAEKYLANTYPELDLQAIKDLCSILEQVKCKKFVLISTIDVYNRPNGVDEHTKVDIESLHAYGANRYYMEEFVRNHFQDYLIVRLPALFGKGLKKNFIFDMMNKIPTMIMESKYKELKEKATLLQRKILDSSYKQNEKGNYIVIDDLSLEQKNCLRTSLEDLGFTSLVFTDCRSKFPFYDLTNLQRDIDRALENDIKELNIAVEPVSAREIAKECFKVEFNNEIIGKEPADYDMRLIGTVISGFLRVCVENRLLPRTTTVYPARTTDPTRFFGNADNR